MRFLRDLFYGPYGAVLRSLPVVVWMAGIFSASTQVMGHEKTSRFILPFLHWLFPGATPNFYNTAHFIIRKGGHLAEYAVLATLLFWALGRRWGVILLLCIAYAIGDEWHQSFVPGRQGAWGDVVIDTIGATLAIGFWHGWFRWREHRQSMVGKSVCNTPSQML